eukprot:11168531-Ditylum_brightwellii.AAC.1
MVPIWLAVSQMIASGINTGLPSLPSQANIMIVTQGSSGEEVELCALLCFLSNYSTKEARRVHIQRCAKDDGAQDRPVEEGGYLALFKDTTKMNKMQQPTNAAPGQVEASHLLDHW